MALWGSTRVHDAAHKVQVRVSQLKNQITPNPFGFSRYILLWALIADLGSSAYRVYDLTYASPYVEHLCIPDNRLLRVISP